MVDQSITVVAATRPHRDETVSGDAWTIEWHNGICQIGLIDALGHGAGAAAVAELARAALAAQPELDPVAALHACHRALIGTRGAAVSVARVDPTARQLTYAGIGNIEARLVQRDQTQRLVAYRGIVGVTIRTVRPFHFVLDPDWLLLLHTDGISSRFETKHHCLETADALQDLADSLLRHWGRPADDASVVVARPAFACS